MKPLLLAFFTCAAATLFAQNYTMNGTPINDCNGSFFDPGGPNNDYGNNLNVSSTLCAGGAGGGTHVRLDFSSVQLAPGDLLCFYDGTNATAPQLSCSDQYAAGATIVVQATAANPSGCITAVFVSNGAGTAPGWSAAISCVKSCQILNADLVSTLPTVSPADTGWIDICPGDRVTFNGAGIYPQNNLVYHQSDFTTSFEWTFGDGSVAYGPTVSHKFNNPGGYYVQLLLRDTLGCLSTNLISQRIRVAPRPDFNLLNNYSSTICAGDSITLGASVNYGSGSTGNIGVLPGSGSFTVAGSRSDSLALPDGTGIDFETSLYFTEFTPGQVLTNINDLEGICVNMEHSWARDIQIKITCPNGSSAILHNHPGQIGGGVNLGIPNDNDNFNPIPGIGFDYCWTPNATNTYWINYFNTVLTGNTLPAGDYQSFQPLTNLLGCPLNGEWTLTATDYWPIDNGYIFSWGVNFNQDLYPAIETFSPSLVNWQWQNQPSIYYSTQDSISASPQNAGLAAYTFTAIDSYGCRWDSTLNVTVRPFTHPLCYTCNEQFKALQDTTVCVGDAVPFDASSLLGNTLEVGFENAANYKFGASNHPHNTPYNAPVTVSSLGYNLLTNPIAQIKSVCVDINTDFDADLNLFLIAPDNKMLELSTQNGGAGDNYKVTCFTPTATAPIQSGTAPFNGNYLPEGPWSSLNNAAVNGDWKLRVSDGFGQSQFSTLNYWNITFNVNNTATYNWTNGTTLTCTNCPTPTATPTAVGASTYIVTATNPFNCVHKDTVVVTTQTLFPAPSGLQVTGMQNGTMTWTWDPVPNATAYEVNVNGTGWVPVNTTTYTVNGLTPGTAVNIQVRAQSVSVNCTPAIASGNKTYVACTLETNLIATFPCSCYGYTDGAVDVVATGGQGQTVYYTNYGSTLPYTNGNLTFYPAGDYFVFAVDAQGCRDTTFFTITQPPRIDITMTPNPVACFGASTGSIGATAVGGTGSHTFLWQGCAGGFAASGSQILNIPAGCYRVTVTDQTGCSNVASTDLTQNPAIVLSSTQDSVSCYGGNDGTATVIVTGGITPYSYAWANADNGPTADNLPAGFHSVTISDGANCNATTVVNVKQPPQMGVDSIVAGAVSCTGSTNGVITVYPKGGTAPYTYQWSGTAQTDATAFNLPAGTYTVTVRDKNGCSLTSTATVTAPAPIAFTVQSTLNAICKDKCNGAATLQATGGTGAYSINWNTPGIPNNALSANTLCDGTYTVSLTDQNGCTAQTTFTITEPQAIALALTPNDPSCPGATDGSILAAGSGGTGTLTYLWNNGSNTATLNNATCTTYTVTVTDVNGCTATSTQTLTCPPTLVLGNVVATAVSCFNGNNGSATVSVSGGTGNPQYIWSDPNDQTTATATNLTAGIYTVTISDGQGCSLTASATITSPTQLTGNTVITDADCFGAQTGSIDLSMAGGTGPYNYVWSNNATTQDLSQVASGTYTVTVTDTQNCTFVLGAQMIDQPSALTVAVEQTAKSCYGFSLGIATATATGGNAGSYQYTWSNNANGPVVNGLAVGTYTVTVSDSKGCTAVGSVLMEQYDSIFANILLVAPTCFGDTDGQAAINLVGGGAGSGIPANYNYQWGGLPNAPTGEYWGNLPGNTPFTLTINDQQGCYRIFDLVLPEPLQVIPMLAVNPISCNGSDDGQVLVSSHQGEHPLVSYLWNPGGAATDSIGQLAPGTYTVTVTDTAGCKGSASIAVTEPTVLAVTFQSIQLKCESNTDGEISASASGGTPGYTYNWSNSQVGASISNLSAGTYQLTLTDNNGCTLVDSTIIAEPTPPTINVRAQDLTCFGSHDGRIDLQIQGATPPYQYALNAAPFIGAPNFLALAAGQYTVQIKDANNCVYTVEATVNQPPAIDLTVNPADTTVLYGDAITLVANTQNAVGIVEYVWDFDFLDSFKCVVSECSIVQVLPEFANNIIVTATDERGCVGTTEVRYAVEKPRDIDVPTGFSPNGDNNNDLLHVFGKSRQVEEVKLFRIYDRWGELIYEDRNFKVNDTARGWDGSFRGQPCMPEVYVWTIEVLFKDGYTKSLYGQTTLIR